MSVRLATNEDAVGLGTLIREALEDAPSAEIEVWEVEADPLALGRRLVEAGPDEDAGFVLVAEIRGEMAGIARVVRRSLARSRHVGEVQLVVHPSARGTGVGRALLETVVRQAATSEGPQLRKLVARAAEDDAGLVGLLVALGWERERSETAGLCRGGRLIDVLVFRWWV